MSKLPTPDALIFDLDGTLWDTCQTCAHAWNEVLARHGIPFRSITGDDVRRVTGKPHDACIRDTFVGLPEAQLELLNRETAVEDNLAIERHGGQLYEGVAEGLRALALRCPLFIVSNCQAGYIELFLRLNGLGPQFRDFECWGNTGQPKPENLRQLIARNALERPWLIGDASGDMQAAEACGVLFVHAAYGFGQVERADLRVSTFNELASAAYLAVSSAGLGMPRVT
jgi:phosphoglycolate phosphatase